MQTPAEAHHSWWIPAVYTLLGTVIGAVVGFAADRVKAWFDARKIKHAFLEAVRVELERLQEQLLGLDEMLRGSLAESRNLGTPHEFIVSLKTKVFESQLANLKDLSDALLLDIVHFYSNLALLPSIVESLNERARECRRITDGMDRARELTRMTRPLENALAKLSDISAELSSLLPRLPAKPHPSKRSGNVS